MSMEINNAYSSYAAETTSSSKSTSKESDTSGTKQYSNVSEYSKYLSEKYDYFNKQSSVYGVPTTVNVSEEFLQKCVDDPEKAEWLERNMKSFAESTKWANNYLKSLPGSPVRVFQSVTIDENGNMSMTSRSTNDPDGRIARENAEKKAREKKEKEEKLAEKRSEKKEQEERLAEMRAKRKEEGEALQSHEVTVVGNDIRNLTEKMVEAISHSNNTAVSGTVGVDIKV